MTEDDLSFLPLRVTRVGVGGKRGFDPADKRRLVEACLRPVASLSGRALKAGVNTNPLHKWVQARERAQPSIRHDVPVASSVFVPVVAIGEPTAAQNYPTFRHAQRDWSTCSIPVTSSRATLRYPGSMNEDDFSRLPLAAQAYIRELDTRNRRPGERITQFEEQFHLAQIRRFAPSSEKLRGSRLQ